ncbi:MAG: hypothetical protein Satyrvirus33_6 [Satyrvirus sp.]|uniref:Uncharacterized protein n=1 Tax=Satyrvirus sp. TaxID=2487771 RepID=A0A3G5AER9_9VIRU|nr:MAG: hypothetical protein Satyrvirus33_6 [Satyrvirus sp.]
MKIDFALTASDMSDHYLKLFPNIFRIWKKKFGIDCKLILISDNIPDFLSNYIEHIILFKPIDKINTIFVAQVVRILYPCLFDNKNVIITDADIFPISYNYFVKSIEDVPDSSFVTYRDAYLKDNMLSICYNVANSKTWYEIFGINDVSDIVNIIKLWYNDEYTGQKNCAGWFTDQKKLYEYVMKWNSNRNRLVILNDSKLNFSRLDKRKRKYILENISKIKDNLKNNLYTDFHIIKPYNRYKKIVDEFVNIICEN